MAQQASLHARSRSGTGKGAARSLRREGKIPAVIYGHGREPEPLEVETTALTRLLVGIAAASTIVDIAVDERAPVKALIREIQRNPIRPDDIIHIDLYEVRADEKITLSVAVHLVGIPDGVRNFGGVLDHSLRELEIRVFPSDIPERVDLDVTALGIGNSLYVRDVKLANVEILNDENLPICSVVAPRAEEVVVPVEVATGTEPELIRKAKAEGEAEGEAEKKS
ncbi:MAG: 50S ribosomal protein L25 [Gemmatimonadota bacterium]